MKKILIEAIIIFTVACYLFIVNKGAVPGTEKSILVAPIPTPSKEKLFTRTPAHVSKTLFVPYWTLGNTKIDTSGYEKIVYFGISADKNGINHNDSGFRQIDTFLNRTDTGKIRLLGVRMINADVNDQVLNNSDLQKKIISETISIAKTNGFKGIVLDFEINALGFHSVVQSIADFEKQFAKTVTADTILFYTTVYGDTFARLRPFDVASIAKYADGVLIMAYDFHKANGDPGANFPLHAKDEYNMSVMVDDFMKYVQPEKITVIFGLYGYDWTVDDQNRTIGQANVFSYNQIQQQFLQSCSYKDCKIRRDNQSSETEITYVDKDNHTHIVWFEDPQSVSQKTDYLKSRGIPAVGYWAYTYF